MTHRLAVLAMLCLCTACSVSRPEITHLQLHTDADAPGSKDAPVILVDAIVLPDYLLRDELLRRADAFRLEYDSLYRWAEPLDLGIQRIVARELQSGLDTRQVVRFPALPRGVPDWELDIEILAFEASGPEVVLRAEGRWATGSAPETTRAAVSFDERLGLDPEAGSEVIARRLSSLLSRFSEELITALQSATTLP